MKPSSETGHFRQNTTVLRDLFDTHDLDGLTIEIAAPTLAPVLLPRAAELIARL